MKRKERDRQTKWGGQEREKKNRTEAGVGELSGSELSNFIF